MIVDVWRHVVRFRSKAFVHVFASFCSHQVSSRNKGNVQSVHVFLARVCYQDVILYYRLVKL